MKFKVKKGDRVLVIAGKDKGKTGIVLRVIRKEQKVVVDGVNIKKKSIKKKDFSVDENFLYIPHPIHISNVKLLSSSNDSH